MKFYVVAEHAGSFQVDSTNAIDSTNANQRHHVTDYIYSDKPFVWICCSKNRVQFRVLERKLIEETSSNRDRTRICVAKFLFWSASIDNGTISSMKGNKS